MCLSIIEHRQSVSLGLIRTFSHLANSDNTAPAENAAENLLRMQVETGTNRSHADRFSLGQFQPGRLSHIAGAISSNETPIKSMCAEITLICIA